MLQSGDTITKKPTVKGSCLALWCSVAGRIINCRLTYCNSPLCSTATHVGAINQFFHLPLVDCFFMLLSCHLPNNNNFTVLKEELSGSSSVVTLTTPWRELTFPIDWLHSVRRWMCRRALTLIAFTATAHHSLRPFLKLNLAICKSESHMILAPCHIEAFSRPRYVHLR